MRGPNYLRDKKKIPASDPLFSLAAVDLVECESGCFHIAQYLPSLKCAPHLVPTTEQSNVAVLDLALSHHFLHEERRSQHNSC